METVKTEHPISHKMLEERRKLSLVGDNIAMGPLVSIATGLLCSEILKYITGIGELTTVRNLKSIDMNTMTTKIAESCSKNKEYKICKDVRRE